MTLLEWLMVGQIVLDSLLFALVLDRTNDILYEIRRSRS